MGSAPLAPRVLERLQEKMPDALVSNNYGMTEAGSVYCLMPPGEAVRRPGSVGKPLPPAEIVCVDDRRGGASRPTRSGEVRMRIPGRPREYFGDPEATARTWVDGWLVTGDLGRIDGDGYLYIVGRSKDVIIRGGNNIHPTDVEHAIALHPAVHEVAVLGVAHPVLGEDIVACVVLRARARGRRRRPAGAHPRAPGPVQGAPPVVLRRRPAPQRHRQGGEGPAAQAPARRTPTRPGSTVAPAIGRRLGWPSPTPARPKDAAVA